MPPSSIRRKHRGSKIVATLGPASAEPETLRRIVDAGMDVVRLNFSHGDHQSHATLVAHVRRLQEETGKPLAIIGDLRGPKIRVGPLDQPLELAPDAALRITVEPGHAGPRSVSCDYAGLPDDVAPGDYIYMRDGEIELEVTSTSGSSVDTVVRVGGRLTSRAGVNLPGVTVRLPVLTDGDLEDIEFAVEQGLDYLALSFVREAGDLLHARERLDALGSSIGLIAKIENMLALHDLDAIVESADGVIVARGDLGVEVGPENVPVWQRRIIAAASRRLVPVIVATQMLESMIEHPRPTRAEASDVANAVWDGADALMLSAESAAGAYPVESVEMMDRIIRRTEESETPATHHDESSWASDPARSISWATREILLHDDSIAGVVVFTMSRYSARLIAKGHLPRDVLAITVDPRVQQQLALLWGVRAVICPMFTNEGPGAGSRDRAREERAGMRRWGHRGRRRLDAGGAAGTDEFAHPASHRRAARPARARWVSR